MPRKIAIFVEGPTEQMFVGKLLTEIAGEDNITIQTGNARSRIRIAELRSGEIDSECFVLLYHCHGDEGVMARIKQNYQNLCDGGYSVILGLRDLYPLNKSELQKVIDNNNVGVNFNVVPVSITISVLETEAWFIKETSHFTRLDANLTFQKILDELGIDVRTLVAEDIVSPSKTLNDIYSLVGLTYDKKRWQVQLTVDQLDYGEIYINLKDEINALDLLITDINNSLECEAV